MLRWNSEHIPQGLRVLLVAWVRVKRGDFNLGQGNASALGADLRNAHVAWAELAGAAVCGDKQFALAHQEEGFFFVHCASQDGASRDAHGASIEAIAKGVIDWHLNLWQLEQLGLQAIDGQMLCWNLLFHFLNCDDRHLQLLFRASCWRL